MSRQEDGAEGGGDWQRLDKWLWCARFLRQRTDCARLAAAGGIRVNRLPTDKPHLKLRVGDVITLPLHHQVRVLRVLALAHRRGSPAEAAVLYQTIVEPAADAAQENQRQGNDERWDAAGQSPPAQPCAREQSPSYAPTEAQGLAGELR